MTEFCGCWDVGRNRRTHYIRSIEGLGRSTVPERVECAIGELGRVVIWLCVEFYSGPTRPSLGERVSDRSRSEDGVDAGEGDGCGCGKDVDHLLHARKNVFGTELI